MGILAPLNARSSQEATRLFARLMESGTGEFYLGFYDQEWIDAFGATADLNRMTGFGAEANALDFSQVCEVAGRMRACGATAFVTFNTAQYTQAQIDFIAQRYLPSLAHAGVSGIICSCPQLVCAAVACGLEAVASTMCGVLNADIARFYKGLGATRIVLPRELSIAEIAQIMREVPDVEYEAFLMRNGCIFSDSHCLGRHRQGCYSLCTALRRASYRIVGSSANWAPARERAERNRAVYSEEFLVRACGLCALWHLERLGVSAYKVVGRGDEPEYLCADIEIVAENIAVARQCATYADYRANMVVPSNSAVLCKDHLSCYYPEVHDFASVPASMPAPAYARDPAREFVSGRDSAPGRDPAPARELAPARDPAPARESTRDPALAREPAPASTQETN